MRLRASALVATAAAALLLVSGAHAARATQVKIFQTQSQAGFLAGKLEGVSVDALGRMELAARAERIASLGEPFLLSAAVHPDGWVVGTGNAGKVLKIDRKGTVTELFAAPEPEVFAVWADPDGTVFAGTSPRGKVYRIPATQGAKAEVYFDPGETYIWTLNRAADGSLLVGTGTQGKLFRLSGNASGKGEILYDSDDTHIRSLEVLPGGDLLIGTAGEGLILRLGLSGENRGQVRTLYDAAQPEVVGLTAAPDGTCYAAVISSEASLTDLTKDAAAATAEATKSADATVTVTVTDDTGAAPGRKAGSGPRSEILSISPAGVVESLWSFADDTVYDLLWRPDGLWIGTGLEGKLYRWADDQMLLQKDVDERQIVAFLPGEPGPSFATTNAAALYRVTAGTEPSGTYTSAVLDAGQVARFGTFRWRGEAREAPRFSFRSGVSAEPDRTWSAWAPGTAVRGSGADGNNGGGQEISLSALPRGRYVQWRAELRSAAGKSPRIDGAELSYRQENLKPRIDLLSALEAGQILVPANFNPSSQVYEPAHPNRDGIFTSAGAPADEDGRTKVLWKQGFRTLRWGAADPNDDTLVYDLSFRPAGEPTGSPSDGWLRVVEELKDPYYSFDSTVLPDGVYRFRLRASDRLSNEPENALATERVSDPVVNDHTPPVLGEVKRDGDRLRVTVRDALSPLREVVYSLGAQEWKPAEAADGLIDGQSETVVIPNTPKGGLVLLRATDAAYNVTTFNLSQDR